MAIGQTFDKGEQSRDAAPFFPPYRQDASHGAAAQHDGEAYAFRHFTQKLEEMPVRLAGADRLVHAGMFVGSTKFCKAAPTPSPTSPSRLAGKASYPLPSRERRSEEHTSDLQSLMRISYADF